MAINRNFIVKQGIQVGGNLTVNNTLSSNTYISNKGDVTSPPALLLDFTKGSIDPTVECTRSSNATYVAANGNIIEVGPNVPRLNWDITTGACLGLFSEEQRINYTGYSDIEGAVGSPPRGMNAAGAFPYDYPVVSMDVWIGPNKQSAKHTRGVTNVSDDNVGYISSITPTVGNTYVATVYVYIPSTSTATYVTLTWESGTVVLNPNVTANANMTIRDTWQRITASGTMTSGSGFMVPVLRMGPIGAVCYTDCWQTEVGAYPTSWIPTTNVTSATRQDDINFVSPITSFYNPTAGTFYGEIMPYWTGTATLTGTRNLLGFEDIQWVSNPVYSQVTSPTLFNGYALYLNPASTANQFGIRDRYGSSIASQEISPSPFQYIQAGSVYKFAGTQHPTIATTVALNGATLSNSNQTIYRSAFQVNKMTIGYAFTGGAGPYQTCGYVRKIIYYPRVFSAAELAALTET